MKCNCCPALIDCSNEDVGYETACWYGDSYQDENCIEFKDEKANFSLEQLQV